MINKNSLKKAFYRFQGYFPTRLPVGVTEFNNWCDKLLFTYFPETAQPPSIESFRFSIAAMILHMDAQASHVPNRYFGKAVSKGASSEVAGYVMRTLKAQRDALIDAQEKAAKEAAQNKLAEATAQLAEASSDPQGIQRA